MNTTISKSDSVILKGIAVIMIIFVHINFMRTKDFFYVCGQPLLKLISGCSAPVEIFTFLGGAGLCITHRKGHDKHRVTRIIKLYLHMWVVMAIFVPIAYFLHDTNCYPSGIIDFINNISGLYSTWNGTYWFVLPYTFLSLSSSWIFRHLNNVCAKRILSVSFLLYFVGYFMRWRYANAEVYILHDGLLSLPVNIALLQFTFLMGYLTVRCDVIAKLRKTIHSKVLCWILFLAIIIMKIFLVKTGFFFGDVYAALFSILFVMLARNSTIDSIFSLLGRHSLNIWFLHGWLVMSIFASFTYSLKYSIVIVTAVLLACTIGSIVVNIICNPIQKMVERKF